MTGHNAALGIELDAESGRMMMVLSDGDSRQHRVPIRNEVDLGSTLRKILESISQGHVEVGSDGAPTGAQVLHWEKHTSAWAVPGCRFCVPAAPKRKPRHTVVAKNHGVEIRKLHEVRLKGVPYGAQRLDGTLDEFFDRVADNAPAAHTAQEFKSGGK